MARTTLMGALTSKDSPFSLRDWDVGDFESVDPTDSFGTKVRVLLKKKKIIQIEPFYDPSTERVWLSDRGRQFFDSIFRASASTKQKAEPWYKKNIELFKFCKNILTKMYLFEYAFLKKNKTHKKYFTVVFENLGLDTLSYFKILLNSFSFFKFRKAETNSISNDFETTFQLNENCTDFVKLNKVTRCLLVGCNLRYESYFLNLNLKKRENKGNFKCYHVGPVFNTTFTHSFLGANAEIFTNLGAGYNLICQELSTFYKPLLILNSEFFKRADKKALFEVIKTLKYSKILTKTWQGLNVLSNSLFKNGENQLHRFQSIKLADFDHFSFLYFVNISFNNTNLTKRIVKLKFLQFLNKKTPLTKKLIVHQSFKKSAHFLPLKKKKFTDFTHIYTANFYETAETFINAEGFINTVQPLTNNTDVKNTWQIFRHFTECFIKRAASNFFTQNLKDNTSEIIFFDTALQLKKYTGFLFFANINLSKLSILLVKKTQKYMFHNKKALFKQKAHKVFTKKFNYWLNSFFTGSSDEYSVDSITLNTCENNTKIASGTFF